MAGLSTKIYLDDNEFIIFQHNFSGGHRPKAVNSEITISGKRSRQFAWSPREETLKAPALYENKRAEESYIERSVFDRLGDLIDQIMDVGSIGKESPLRKIPDIISRIDDMTLKLQELINLLYDIYAGAKVGTSPNVARAAKENLGYEPTWWENAFLTFGAVTTFPTQAIGLGTGDLFGEAWARAIKRRAALYRKAQGDIDETNEDMKESFIDKFGFIGFMLETVANQAVVAFESMQDKLVGHSIIPDTLAQIESTINAFIPTMTLLAGNLTLPLQTAFSTLESNVLTSISNIASSYNTLLTTLSTTNIPAMSLPNTALVGASAVGGMNFVFAPVLNVSGEVDKTKIYDILSEQRRDFEKSMRQFFRQEVRR